jgi:putative hydrolase of the HAD superfamily
MAQKIDWGNIDTILLDMDGTLLDLHFDLHFWMEYMPLVFAKKHNITCDEAKDKLYPILRAEEGKLHWYCLDYWQEKLQLDIAQLKEDVAHLIQIHPFVLAFLEQAKTNVGLIECHPYPVRWCRYFPSLFSAPCCRICVIF